MHRGPGSSEPRQRCIPLRDADAWCRALQGIRHGFAHTWENCHAAWLTTGHNTFLYCLETDQSRLVCPIAERPWNGFTDIVTPYGYSGFVGIGSSHELAEHWGRFVREREYVCGYIGLNPALDNDDWFPPASVFAHNEVYLLDLTLSDAELWANLSEKRRKQIRECGRRGDLEIIHDRERLTCFFLEHYAKFFQQRKATQAGASFSRPTLDALLASHNVLLIGAQEHGALEAVFLFTFTPFCAEGLFNISTERGRCYTACLTWYGVQWLKTRNVPVLNLGGGVMPGDTIAEFKRRFGSTRVALSAARQIYRPDVYEQLCAAAGVPPTISPGYFPSYRALD